MTPQELLEIEAHYKAAVSPDGSCVADYNIIRLDVPRLIAEVRECWRVMMRPGIDKVK